MKKVIQKRIVETRVIQKEIAEYYCDSCGNQCGVKGNLKKTWYGPGGVSHYCKKTCRPSDRGTYARGQG